MKRERRIQLRESENTEKIRFKKYTHYIQYIFFSTGLLFIIPSSYLAFRKTDLSTNELETVYAQLKSDLTWDYYSIKTTKYHDIIIKTKEYNREFRISGKEFESVNHFDLEKEVKKGDLVGLLIKPTDKSELNNHSITNDYNVTYGIIKDGKNYSNLEYRNALMNKDKIYALVFAVPGLIICFLVVVSIFKQKHNEFDK